MELDLIFKLDLEVFEFEYLCQNWNCMVLNCKEPSSNPHPRNQPKTFKCQNKETEGSFKERTNHH